MRKNLERPDAIKVKRKTQQERRQAKTEREQASRHRQEEIERQYRNQQRKAARQQRKEQKREADSKELLKKVLGLLSSEHDGEALNAAREAEAMRRKLRLTWDDIIK
jgi:hypothetical protein